MMNARLISIVLCLGAAACVEDAGPPPADDTGEATQELQGPCDVYERGVLVVDDGYWANPKTCCKKALSSPNEQWCYLCTDPRYDCFGWL
jgi:hypothetical protein